MHSVHSVPPLHLSLSPQGFSRGSSSYRGVTAHPSGRWESRIGIPGSKHIYLGLFEGERDAAAAYDRSLVRLKGPTAATNFSLSEYRSELSEFHVYGNVSSGSETICGCAHLRRAPYLTLRHE